MGTVDRGRDKHRLLSEPRAGCRHRRCCSALSPVAAAAAAAATAAVSCLYDVQLRTDDPELVLTDVD